MERGNCSHCLVGNKLETEKKKELKLLNLMVINNDSELPWLGSQLVGVPSSTSKGCRSNSQSEHIPRL